MSFKLFLVDFKLELYSDRFLILPITEFPFMRYFKYRRSKHFYDKFLLPSICTTATPSSTLRRFGVALKTYHLSKIQLLMTFLENIKIKQNCLRIWIFVIFIICIVFKLKTILSLELWADKKSQSCTFFKTPAVCPCQHAHSTNSELALISARC